MESTEQAHEFLEALWGTGPPRGQPALLWFLKADARAGNPHKASHWIYDFASAAKLVQLRPGYNAYTGMSLPPTNFPCRYNRRVPAGKAAAIPGLWADLDIASTDEAVHRKKELPPDVETVLDLLNSLPVRPTLIINSGNGLQAYWLFDQPWHFNSPSERQQAAALAVAWHRMALANWQSRGWQLDATHDLARVMRLPGSWNQKNDPPRPVQILERDGPRLRREAAETFVRDLGPAPAADGRKQPGKTGGDTILDPGAEPPMEKLQWMVSGNPMFRDSWLRNRPDLSAKSPSEYDFSLASLAIAHGWDDQEIMAMLIAWRRLHGIRQKETNYYYHTIQKLREQRNARLCRVNANTPESTNTGP